LRPILLKGCVGRTESARRIRDALGSDRLMMGHSRR
jgi:hypothetical protein